MKLSEMGDTGRLDFREKTTKNCSANVGEI